MSTRKYPYISDKSTLKSDRWRKHPSVWTCCLCGDPGANQRITVQWSWFRGDDTAYNVHRECLNALSPTTDSERVKAMRAGNRELSKPKSERKFQKAQEGK